MKYENMPARELETLIRKYIDDAAHVAMGQPWGSTNAYLDGISGPEELAKAIRDCGAAYLKKLQILAKADPTVRGNSISIYEPKPPAEANAPSREDEAFCAACRKQLLSAGFVLAADADTYEAISKKYPGTIFPARVRGSEARRWVALHRDDAVLRSKKARSPLK